VILGVSQEPRTDESCLLVGEPFDLPLLDDFLFDDFLRQVGQLATVLVRVASDAEPVAVGSACPP
jgi:hypothetical protein